MKTKIIYYLIIGIFLFVDIGFTSKADSTVLNPKKSQYTIKESNTFPEPNTSDSNNQIPGYYLVATCFYCGYAGPSAVNFRIYIASMDSNYFEYSGGKFCFQVDTTVANGGDLTFEFFSSDLPTHLWPGNPAVYRIKDKFVLFLDRNEFPGSGNGYDLTRRAIHLADLRISTTASELNVTSLYETFYWRHSSDTVIATRIYSYVDSINTNITNSGLHGVDFMFPVELSNFSFLTDINNIKLNWTTTKEINNSGFEIERSEVKNNISGDWKKIGFMNGRGTTELHFNYEFTDRDLNTGKYKYRLKQIDFNGNYEYFNLHDVVDIGIPLTFSLSQNYPNPFNPSTKISYSIPEAGFTELKIFDITGKEILKLINEKKTAGYYTVNFNGSHLPSGIYIYKLNSNNISISKKMLLVK